MKSYFCSQQERVSVAIQAGQWPDGCDPEVRAHAETCETCRDLALVAQTLHQSRHVTARPPQLPSPGLLWWRAQIRRRNDAIERMTRPIAIAEKIAVLAVLLAAVALIAWLQKPLTSWLSSVWGPLSSAAQAPSLLLLGVGTLIVFGGFTVYLLKAKE